MTKLKSRFLSRRSRVLTRLRCAGGPQDGLKSGARTRTALARAPAPARTPVSARACALLAPLDSPPFGTAATRFVRAYAFAAPHTVTRRGRSCRSCHLDSIALGFGEGTLRVEAKAWRFEPKWPASPFDGLPLDAWIGFLADAPGHDPEQKPALYRDWAESRTRLTAACQVPPGPLR